MSKIFTLQALATALDGELVGDGALAVTRVAHPADIHDAHDLALAFDKSLIPLLQGTGVQAAVVGPGCILPEGLVRACIRVERPRLAMAKLTSLFAVEVPVAAGVHASAVVEPGARLGANVAIGAFAYVGGDAVIGDDCTLHPQVYVGPGVTLGNGSVVHAGARLAHRVSIGARAIIHANATVGADGFSFVTPQPGSVEDAKSSGGSEVAARNQELVRIASLGTVVVGDDVEIGANTSIDRGTIAATRIGRGTKIDNQVQIGHNAQIGENCLICGRVGIAGSAVIGDRVVLGGAVGVADHVTIGDDAVAMAMSGIASNVAARTVVGGVPALPRDRVIRNLFNVERLKQFFKKFEGLAERVDALEQSQKKD